ncbi:MAG: orotate phosphoribosyltransferase [Thermoplasmata archaeon]|nr:orotate phosphoribosyltransferase [Thermoplasmata archaeon]
MTDAAHGVRQILLDSGAVKFGKFTLTSGRESDVYVDVKQAWTRPDRLRPIAAALAERVRDEQRLAGVELGAVPLVVATALATGRPYLVVRKPGREHGTGRTFEGDLPPGATCLLIEDVVTTGGSVAAAVELLRAAGAKIERVLTVIDRQEGGAERLATLGVQLEALATLASLRDPS